MKQWLPVAGSSVSGKFSWKISHRSTGERLELSAVTRDDSRPCYAKTAFFNLYYRSDHSGSHTSPEADLLLPVWVEWVRKLENDGLRPPKTESQTKSPNEYPETGQKGTAPKTASPAETWLFGSELGIKSDESLFKLFFMISFCALLLFTLPRFNGIELSLSRDDFRFLSQRSWANWLLLIPASTVYALRVLFHHPTNFENAELSSLPLSQMLERYLCSGMAGDSEGSLTICFFLAAISFAAACLMASYASQVLFWDRRITLLTRAVYALILLTSPLSETPLLAPVLHLALFSAILAIAHQANDIMNSWRILAAIPALIVASWIDPATLVFFAFYFLYLLIASKERQRVFSFPPTWIAPLAVLLFAAPSIAMLKSYSAIASSCRPGIASFILAAASFLFFEKQERLLLFSLGLWFLGSMIFAACFSEGSANTMIFPAATPILILAATATIVGLGDMLGIAEKSLRAVLYMAAVTAAILLPGFLAG